MPQTDAAAFSLMVRRLRDAGVPDDGLAYRLCEMRDGRVLVRPHRVNYLTAAGVSVAFAYLKECDYANKRHGPHEFFCLEAFEGFYGVGPAVPSAFDGPPRLWPVDWRRYIEPEESR